MYDIFLEPRRNYSGLLSEYVINTFQRRAVEDVERTIDYYRLRNFATDNNHLLSQIILLLGVPLSYDLLKYHELVLARSYYVANALKLTTSINYGQWHVGTFYYNCPELIIAYNGEDSPIELIKDWRNLSPVKVLTSPISNLNYLLPDGKNNSSERGLAVIGIDLAMLMIQYRGYLEDIATTEGYVHPKFFLMKYVLPNMLKSQTDWALFNRLYNLEMGAPMGEAYRRLPFHISHYEISLDKLLETFLSRLRDSSRDYENYIEQFPSVFSDTPLRMPDMAETRQVWWALFLARQRVIEFLLDIGGNKGIQHNRALINQLKMIAKRFLSDGIYERVLPDAMKQDMRLFLKRIIDLK